MQRTMFSALAATLLLAAGLTASAQNTPGPRGPGYGSPPATTEERAARQAACPQGQCPLGGQGPCVTGEARGKGWCGGRGTGEGGCGRGLRDGTGPRSQNGTCPLAKPASPAPAKK